MLFAPGFAEQNGTTNFRRSLVVMRKRPVVHELTGVDRMQEDPRVQAYEAVRIALRKFADSPTGNNLQEAESAWRELRRLNALSLWRDWKNSKLNASPFPRRRTWD